MNESEFKQRMIGAIVLIALGVIFIPILLNGEDDDGMPLFSSNIPERHKSITNMKPLKLSSNISPAEVKLVETILVDELSPTVINNSKEVDKLSDNSTDSVELNTDELKTTKNLSEPVTTIKPVELTETKTQSNTSKVKPKPTDGVTDTQKNKVITLKATAWIIQVGSFSNKKNAIKLQNKLRNKKFHAFVEAVKTKSELNYRVRIGPEVKKNVAQKIQKRLKKDLKINGIVMKYKG